MSIDLNMVLNEIRDLRKAIQAPMKRLLTIPEAAHDLGLAEKTVRNRVGPKSPDPFPIKPVKLAGRVLFRREDMDAYVDGLAGGEE